MADQSCIIPYWNHPWDTQQLLLWTVTLLLNFPPSLLSFALSRVLKVSIRDNLRDVKYIRSERISWEMFKVNSDSEKLQEAFFGLVFCLLRFRGFYLQVSDADSWWLLKLDWSVCNLRLQDVLSVSVTKKQTVSLPLVWWGLTFFCTTSCQLMVIKNLWLITSLASSGPPPNLWVQRVRVKVSVSKQNTHRRWQSGWSTSVWGLSWADRPAATWPRATDSWGSGSPPWGWVQTDARGPGCRKADGRTSSHTWQHPDPTSPLPGRSRYLLGPERQTHDGSGDFELAALNVHLNVHFLWVKPVSHHRVVSVFFSKTNVSAETSSVRGVAQRTHFTTVR